MLLNNQWITEEIKDEVEKYLEANDSKTTTLQNLWDAAKAVLSGKFIAIFFLLLIPSHIALLSEMLLDMISIFLKLLRLDL